MKIKFRAWNTQQGKMYSWTELCSDFHWLRGALNNESLMTNPPTPFWETMQFAEKKDKNEVAIYEGDILSVDGDKMVVIWDGENLQWCVKGNGCPDLELWYVIDDGSDSFVIGNIYENPELIK